MPRIDGAFLEFRPDDGDIASVITRRFLLFVGGLVFFIDHDEAEIFERRENRAAGADDDAGAAGMELVPFVVPFAFGKMTVQDRNHVRLRGEATLESFDRLRGERDFRDEDDRGLAAREGGADRLQINFRLAAAGHAVEENRRVRFGIFERGFDQLQGRSLLFVHHQFGVGDEFLGAMRIAGPRLAPAIRRIRA